MIYILYDTALNGLYTLNQLQKAYPDNLSLFKGTRDENLFDVAPYLFRVDNQFFEKINDPYVSMDAMVVIESDQKLNDLLEHFEPFIYQRINGQENYFRFWDARVLGRFLPECAADKLNSFFDGIISFYVLDTQKESANNYFIKRNKLQSDTIDLSKLFIIPNDKHEQMQPGEITATGIQSKTTRTFFK